MEVNQNKMESINAIHKTAEQTIHDLKKNINDFLDDINSMRNKICQRMSKNILSPDEMRQIEREMDNFITHLSITTFMVSQFHRNLGYIRTTNTICFHGRGDLLPNEYGLPYLKILSTDWSNTCQLLTSDSAIKNGYAQSEYSFKCTTEATSIQSYDLTEFRVGQTFRAKITHIKDHQQNIFYVSKMANSKLEELSLMKNLCELEQLPSVGSAIFGISICEKIYRAVRHDTHNKCILLIDCGIVVFLEDTNSLYHIPDEYIHIPSQAILCQLVGVVDREMIQKKFDLQQVLYTLENKTALFLVKAVKDSKLLVEILSNAPEVQKTQMKVDDERKQEEKGGSSTSNPFSDICKSPLKHNMKSNNIEKVEAKQEVLEISEDIIVTNKIEEIPSAKDITIRIFVTHIVGIVEFYAQLPNDNHEDIILSWRDEEVESQQLLIDLPNVGDMLLARFNADGLWYRAQVMAINNEDRLITVFFMDFGNEETVRLHAIAEMPINIRSATPRAKRFTLANIEDATVNNRELHKRAMQTLSVLLLNEELKVTVIGTKPNGDIIIDFVDEDFIKMKNNLLHKNFVKLTD